MLKALGWDHPRCMGPMRACAGEWQRRTGEPVEWGVRSLEAFGDQPLEEAVLGYDLVVIDHPFCGRAVETACLTPLDALLAGSELAELAAGSVGPSHASYDYAGHQWALATDAACHVAAVRDDLIGPDTTPKAWAEVLDLARRRPGAVALPLSPPHAICSWLSIAASLAGAPFADPAADRTATETLAELARLGPAEALGWEPPDALHAMTSADAVAYIPLTFGYSGYAVDAPRPCRFVDVPATGGVPRGAVLGGAGLAVTATATDQRAAAAFAAWASGAEAQAGIVARHGGQPGHRAAWDDPQLDALSGGFYSGTRASLEHAWMRPRESWWPAFQLEAGTLLNAELAATDPGPLTDSIHQLHRRHAT